MRRLGRFFSAEVTIGREALWIAWAVQCVTVVAFLAIAIFVIDPAEDDPPPAIVATEIALLAAYVLCVATSAVLGIKRLQTRGLSGWWCLMALVPFVGIPWYVREVGFRPDARASDVGPESLRDTYRVVLARVFGSEQVGKRRRCSRRSGGDDEPSPPRVHER